MSCGNLVMGSGKKKQATDLPPRRRLLARITSRPCPPSVLTGRVTPIPL